jgi:hypothetical protein
LKITAKWKPLPNLQNDVAVMEALTETGDFSAKDLKDINRCRIYLRVFYISDISTHDGKESQPGHGREDEMEEGSHPGHASSTTANLVESMETGTIILSTRCLCCTAIR